MALALDGPRITFFGARAGTGVAVCWALGGTGFLAWLWTRSKLEGSRWRLTGIGLVVLTSAALLLSWRYALVFSWQAACSNGDAYACESTADLAPLLGYHDWRKSAHRQGCRTGASSSCHWLLENDVSLERAKDPCDHLSARCTAWKQCRDAGEVDGVDCDRPTYSSTLVGAETHCQSYEHHCQPEGHSSEDFAAPIRSDDGG